MIIYHLPPIKGTRNSCWESRQTTLGLVLSTHFLKQLAQKIWAQPRIILDQQRRRSSLFGHPRKTHESWLEPKKKPVNSQSHWWWKKNPANQLIWQISYCLQGFIVSYMSLGAGFLPSTVCSVASSLPFRFTHHRLSQRKFQLHKVGPKKPITAIEK